MTAVQHVAGHRLLVDATALGELGLAWLLWTVHRQDLPWGQAVQVMLPLVVAMVLLPLMVLAFHHEHHERRED